MLGITSHLIGKHRESKRRGFLRVPSVGKRIMELNGSFLGIPNAPGNNDGWYGSDETVVRRVEMDKFSDSGSEPGDYRFK
jgi:hypothetical protein